MNEADLRYVLGRMDGQARDSIRRALIADQPHRDAMASRLLRLGTDHAESLANLIDMLTLDADRRRQVVRLLGELEASG